MAKKGSFSKVYDKNGDYVDVEAARFDGTRTFQMQGDVSATQTWNGDSASALTLNTSIGAKKVTTDKINDKAVQTGQIDDGAVGLTQIATNAMNGTVQDNDSKLATHAAVKTYVDSQISGQGTYLGKHTVAEINAMVTDNLHNGDRVMTSDSGTINLGPGGVGFDVEAGEDLILYKSGSTVQWDSMDGNFKTKQTAVSDPTASGTGLTFIDSASQDENGEMTLSKKTVQDGTTSQKGVVQLEDSHSSTSTTKAATPNSVKEAYDLASTANSGLANKQDKPSSATENNIATFNGTKSTKDSGKAFLPSTSTWDGTSDDKVPTAKAVQALLDDKADFNKVVAIADATIVRTGQSGSGWYKFAECTFNSAKQNINSILDVYASYGDTKFIGNISICVRSGNSSGSAITVKEKTLFTDKWGNDFNFKIVVRGTTGSATVELWACCTRSYCGVSIIERNTSSFTATNTKQGWWTYTSYSQSGGSSAPETDAGNNVTVTDVDIVYRQHAVVPTAAGNFAGLDANGLLTDSGKKTADFATAAQGTKADSAVQDVTVDGASVVNSSTKVAAVPNASTSAKGAVQLAGSIGATVASENNKAASEKAVRDAVNALDAEVTSSDGTNVQVKVTEADGKISAVNITTDNTENKNNKVTAWSETTTDAHYPSEKLVKDNLDAKADKVSGATSGNFAGLDSNGNLTDSGSKASDFATSEQGRKADSAIQGVKVNNTTLTPDANKVVTVPLATTSADGAMSAADKTKLDGIAAGAEANVQADWDETSSSSDAFIKNKPYYVSSSRSEIAYLKVCKVPTYNSDAVAPGVEIDILCRFGSNSFKATILYKNAWTLLVNQNGAAGSAVQQIKFYYAASSNSKIDIYAYVPGATVLVASNSLHQPKSAIDFTDFNTVVESLPDGYQEITPKYIAYSSTNSGTAPVKVGQYGALTPVPMDSTPTASSTNLMTSGDIKTALDTAVDSVDAINPYVGFGDNGVKKAWAYLGKFRRINLASNRFATIGLIVRHVSKTQDNSPDDYFIDFACSATVVNAKSALINSVASSTDLVTFYTKYDSTTSSWLLYAYCNNNKNWGSYAVYNNRVSPKADCEYDTTDAGYIDSAPEDVTAIPGYIDVNIASGVGKGSTSVPVYVKADGSVDACTDDFARDSEVVTNVEYVAAQSGGGGSLNKTKNGSTSSVLAFMTTAEAHSLWTNAKANAS